MEGATKMGFPHVFHEECLCLQLLVLMTVYPCFGHMSSIKGGPESAGHDLIWLCPCWEMTAPPCHSPRKCSLVTFLHPSLSAAEFPVSHTGTAQQAPFFSFKSEWQFAVSNTTISKVELVVYSPLCSQGKCFPCAEHECPLMGHSADKFDVADGVSKYFLNTGRSNPFGRKYPVLPVPAKIKLSWRKHFHIFTVLTKQTLWFFQSACWRISKISPSKLIKLLFYLISNKSEMSLSPNEFWCLKTFNIRYFKMFTQTFFVLVTYIVRVEYTGEDNLVPLEAVRIHTGPEESVYMENICLFGFCQS